LAYLGFEKDSTYAANYTLSSRSFSAKGNFDKGYKVVYTSKEKCLENKKFTYTFDIGCSSPANSSAV
jgi:hypothetical protein